MAGPLCSSVGKHSLCGLSRPTGQSLHSPEPMDLLRSIKSFTAQAHRNLLPSHLPPTSQRYTNCILINSCVSGRNTQKDLEASSFSAFPSTPHLQ